MDKKAQIKLFIIGILLLLVLSVFVLAITIEIVESGENIGGHSSIAMNSDDIIHMVHRNMDNGDLRYCNNSGGSWSCINLTSGIDMRNPSIAIDSKGVLNIMVYNFEASQLNYLNNSGGSWNGYVVLNVNSPNPSIAIDSNDVVHFSFFLESSTDLMYGNNSGGSWSFENIDDAGSVGNYPSMAIDSTDTIHISHYKDDSGDLRYCNNSGGSWSCVSVETDNDVGRYSSLTIGLDNVVHISGYDATNGDLRYCNNSGGSWSCVPVDTEGNTGVYSSIDSGIDNIISIVSFDSDENNTRYCNNSGGSWSCYNLFSVGTDPTFGSPSNRWMAIKKGRVSGISNFSSYAHMGFYNTSINFFYAKEKVTPLGVLITYPSNDSYGINVMELNYTLNNVDCDSVWYSLDLGVTNSSRQDCGLNWTSMNYSQEDNFIKIYSNDTDGLVYDSSTTFYIDSIPPDINITSITTVNSSQTFTFNSTTSDVNLDSCKYTIFNSSGDVDVENTTFTCNVVEQSATVTLSGTNEFNLTIYSSDIFGNENSSTLNFSIIFGVEGYSDSSGGGVGGTTEPQRTETVCMVRNFNITGIEELQRCIIYARIKEVCVKDICSLNLEKKNEIIKNLNEQEVTLNSQQLELFLNSYNNKEIEAIKILDSDIEKYSLFTGIIQGVSFDIVSGITDKYFIALTNYTEYFAFSNRELVSCEVVDGDVGFSCLAKNTTAKISYSLIGDLDYTFKTVESTISFVDIDNNSVFKKVRIRVVRPTIQLLILVGSIALISGLWVFNKKRIIKYFNKLKNG